MATVQGLAPFSSTNVYDFMTWATLISRALATFGWAQTGDTGQAVWAGTQVHISNAVAASSVVTFTYDATNIIGPQLAVGMQVIVTGATTAGLNATYTIVSLGGSGTAAFFTAATGTTVTEAEPTTCSAVVNTRLTITNAIGNGVSGTTYTYDATQATTGAAPKIGQSVVVTGCTTTGFNTTSTITAVGGSGATSTITTNLNFSHATEVETGTGTVVVQSAIPTSGNNIYEVWTTTDALSSGGTPRPIYMKVQYGNTSNAPVVTITIGTGSNGAGTLVNAGTAVSPATNTTPNTTKTNCFLSGDSSSFRFSMWAQNSSVANMAFFCLERSVDSTGAETNEYCTYITCGGNSVSTHQQSMVLATGTTTTDETSGLATVVPFTATTGSFGTGTMICPVFPLVGGLGNPMRGCLAGKSADFSANVTLTVTLYNVVHTYLTVLFNSATPNGAWTNAHTSCVGLMRYE